MLFRLCFVWWSCLFCCVLLFEGNCWEFSLTFIYFHKWNKKQIGTELSHQPEVFGVVASIMDGSSLMSLFSMELCVYWLSFYCLYLVQSSSVQSGEQIMQYGQSIDDGGSSQGLIPRLLGLYILLLLFFALIFFHFFQIVKCAQESLILSSTCLQEF